MEIAHRGASGDKQTNKQTSLLTNNQQVKCVYR